VANVFLIDDDVDLVEMNRLVLTSRGHHVTCAYSGAEAAEAIKACPPDIVVLDVMMESDTAGFKLARDIHAWYPDLPTIMLTGIHAATGVPFRFEPDETWLPVVRFLDKPVAPAALADEVEAFLAQN
jgi:CheY-like chemotaxis protein